MEKFFGTLVAFVGIINLIFLIRADQEITFIPIFYLLFGSILITDGTLNRWYKWPIIGALVLVGTALYVHGTIEPWHKLVFFLILFPATLFALFYGVGKKTP